MYLTKEASVRVKCPVTPLTESTVRGRGPSRQWGCWAGGVAVSEARSTTG